MVHINTPWQAHPTSKKSLTRTVALHAALIWVAYLFLNAHCQAQICCPISQPQGANINLSLGANGTAEINPTLFVPYVSSPNSACLPANGGIIKLWKDASASDPFPNTTYNCAQVGISVNVFVTLEVPGNSCATPSSAPFVVNIVDFVPPVATFPANVTQPADNNACSSQVDSLTALVSDNCMSSFTVNWTRTGATTGSGTNSANGIYNVGTTTINWQVIYLVSAGNNDTITGTTTVIIQDTQNPTIQNCPTNITLNNASGQCQRVVNWTNPTISDNCPGVSSTLTSSPTAGLGNGSNFPVGTTTLIYTATDAHGNTSSCSFTVTVNDTEAPTFTNQISSLIVSPSPGCSQFVNLSGTTATDNCGLNNTNYVNGLSFSIVTNSGGPPPVPAANNGDPSGVYPIGDYDITFTAHDIHGNTASYTINLVVEDQQNPVAKCYYNRTISLNSMGMYWVKPIEIDSASMDNCGITNRKIAFDADMNGQPDGPGFFQDSIKFDCMDIPGPHTVLLEVIDGKDNRDTCSTLIMVQDVEPPVALCKDITVDLSGTPPTVNVGVSDIDDGSYDNCTPSASLNLQIRKGTTGAFGPGPLTFGCMEVGANTVEIQVTDAYGNSNICQSTVTVRDTTPPVAMAVPFTAVLGSNGQVLVTPAKIDNSSSDDCGIVKYEISRTSANSGFSTVGVTFTCNDLDGNPHNVWLRIMDQGDGTTGNASVVMTTVTVQDNTNPTALCKDYTAQLDATGNVTIVPDSIDNGSSDNCSIVNKTVMPNTFNCTSIASNPHSVTLTVEDQSGNSSSCAASVTVVDKIAPVAICVNVTVALGSNGQVNVGPATIGALSTDNCGLFSFTLGVDTNRDNVVDSTLMPNMPYTFDCNDVNDPGGVFVSVTVTDINNNVSTCNSTVTVTDTEKPVITCPADVTIECDQSDQPANTGPAMATDNCGVDTITWSDTHTIYPHCVGVDTIWRVWTATDVNGNTSTCSQVIYIKDSTVPTFTAPADTTLNCPDSYVVANQVCTTYMSTNVPVNIPSVGTPTVISTITIPNQGKILDLNIVNLNIEHTFIGDLRIFLKSPNGTEIFVVDFDDKCSNEDNVEINFDDEGVGPYPAFPCPPTDQMFYKPKNLLSSFYQENIQGTWTLRIEDIEDLYGGNLISWGLEICYVTPAANPSADQQVAALTGDVTNEQDNCDPNPQATFKDYHAYKDFTSHAEGGMYDFSFGQWASSGSGQVIDNSPTSVQLVSHLSGTTNTDFKYNSLPASGWVAFDWTKTGDTGDAFAYFVGATEVVLTTPGRVLVPVSSGQMFGFRQKADGDASTATTTITNFVFIDASLCPIPVDGCPRKYCVARIWSLSDDCGNAAADQLQIIRTQDETAPVIDIPATMTVLATNGVCAPFIDLDLSQEISDGCTAFEDLLITNDALANYGKGNGTFDASGFYAPGTYTITFTAADECGNSTSHELSLTVLDAQAPTAVCHPTVTVQLDNNGMATLTPANVNNGSTDNCGITNMSLSQSTFTVDDIGQVPVTLTVMDAAGNSNSCNTVVTVLGGVIFDAGDTGGPQGGMALVPVTVQNFTDITSFQFELEITDASVATVVGVQDVHPALTGFLATVNSPTKVTVSWFDSTTPIGQSFPNGTVIFNLKVMINGVPGASTPVELKNEQSSQLVNGGPSSAMVPTLGLAGIISVLNTGVTHTISGNIQRESNCGSSAINQVTVNMTGSAVGTVNANGSYSFSVPQNASVTITPSKNINWQNGVTVNDALLVHQHAGGFMSLPSPYAMIAGDANHDNKITVFDASLIHQLSIGFITSLPGNTSWRFVPANPPLPANPFPVGNEFLSYSNVTADITDGHFIGMKIGDVNCSANPLNYDGGGNVDDRAEKLRFAIEDQRLTAGQDVWVTFKAADFRNMNAYQMTVKWDNSVLQYVDAVPGNVPNLTEANFNPLRSSEGLLATNWYNLTPVELPDGYEIFTLHFVAMEDAPSLQDLLSVSEDYIVIEAVNGDSELMGVGLTFEFPTATGEKATDQFALYQNKPNPFATRTMIGFHLPTADDAVLTLTDATGKVIKVVKGYFTAGYHQVVIDRDDLPAQGMVFYRLETSTHSAVRKMIVSE